MTLWVDFWLGDASAAGGGEGSRRCACTATETMKPLRTPAAFGRQSRWGKCGGRAGFRTGKPNRTSILTGLLRGPPLRQVPLESLTNLALGAACPAIDPTSAKSQAREGGRQLHRRRTLQGPRREAAASMAVTTRSRRSAEREGGIRLSSAENRASDHISVQAKTPNSSACSDRLRECRTFNRTHIPRP